MESVKGQREFLLKKVIPKNEATTFHMSLVFYKNNLISCFRFYFLGKMSDNVTLCHTHPFFIRTSKPFFTFLYAELSLNFP